jgi:hypothetical protein
MFAPEATNVALAKRRAPSSGKHCLSGNSWRLQELAPSVRADLEAAWSERPEWANALVERSGVYGIDLEDRSYLVLAQLEDTTYVVAGVDPRRGKVRRYEPTGELMGEYQTLREAILATSGRRSEDRR